MTLGRNAPGLPETGRTCSGVVEGAWRMFQIAGWAVLWVFVFKKLHVRGFTQSKVNGNIS